MDEKLTFRIARQLVRLRYLIAVVVLSATVFFGFYAAKVQFLHDLDVWFEKGDPKVDNYHWYNELFPSDQIVLISFDTKDPFGKRDFTILKQLSDGLEKLTIRRYPPVWQPVVDGINQVLTGEKLPPFRPISRVLSFSTVKHAVNEWMLLEDEEPSPPKRFWIDEGDERDSYEPVFKVAKFVQTEARTRTESRYMIKKALENERFRNSLASRSGTHVAVVATIHGDVKNFWHKGLLRTGVLKLVARVQKQHDRRLYVASMPFLGLEFRRLNNRDQTRLFPLVILLVLLTLLVLFRTASGVIIPVVVVGVSVVWVRGMMGLMHIDDTIVAGMLPALLISVCIADMVHYYSDYRHLAQDLPKREAVVQALGRIMKPCFYTSITTAFGFGSLMVSDLRVISTFGLLAACGVAIAFILSTVALPICLDLLWQPKKKQGSERKERSRNLFVRLMTKAAALTRRRPKEIFVSSVVLVALCSIGMVQVKLETDDLKLIRKNNPVRKDIDTISTHLAGVAPIVLVFDTFEKNAVKNPGFLRKLDALQVQLRKSEPAVRQITSVVDFIKEFRGIYMGGEPAEYRVPKSRAAVGQLLGQLEGDHGEMGDFVDFNYRYARVVIRTTTLGSEARARLYDRISVRAKKLELIHEDGAMDPAKLKVTSGPPRYILTGISSIFVRMSTILLSSQLKSFSFALVVIFFLMVLQLKSWKLGLISMIPNVLPLFVYTGIMGVAGINLDIGTAMIASVAIGISVDDTIHFMERHRSKVRELGDYHQATLETMQEVGVAITFTSLILCIGFGTLVFGQFVPTTYFGMLTCITMVAALFADLFLLPIVINRLKPYKLAATPKDNV